MSQREEEDERPAFAPCAVHLADFISTRASGTAEARAFALHSVSDFDSNGCGVHRKTRATIEPSEAGWKQMEVYW